MVQVIEQEDFGGRLGSALGEGAQGLLQTLIQNKLKAKQQRQQLLDLNQILGGDQLPAEKGTEEEEFVEYTPGQLLAAEKVQPGASKILMETQKGKKAKFEEERDKKKVEQTLKNMLKTVKYVGPGKIGNVLTGKGRAARQYYDSLGMQLEKIGASMVGKGQMSKPRFEYLLKNLPSSNKTQAANLGAIKAWSETLGVPMEIPEIDSFQEELEVEEGPKTLSKDKAMEFLEQAKGDKDKARKIARKHGYQF